MRYVKITDIRSLIPRTSASVYAVWYACNIMADFKTHKLKTTRQKMAQEIGITIAAFRHAIATLEAAGLIKVEADNYGTIIRITTEDIPLHLSEKKTLPVIKEALPVLRKHSDRIEKTLQKKPGTLHVYYEPFAELQWLASKIWTSEKDVVSHFVNWYIKAEKTNYAKRVAQEATPSQPYEPKTQEGERIRAQRDAVRAEWEAKVAEARAKGDDAFLNEKYTQIAIRRYGL